jgi:ketosteroid isomerase-like protein
MNGSAHHRHSSSLQQRVNHRSSLNSLVDKHFNTQQGIRNMRVMVRRFGLIPSLVIAAIGCASAVQARSIAATPAQVADELLAADRAFSEASAKTDLISGLSAMFASDVTMPIPGGVFANSKDEAVAALKTNPANATSKAAWTPVRAGVSADGLQGFTFGYITTTKSDGTNVNGKYLSYWVKGSQGWRVAAYKRSQRAAGEPSMALDAPALPPKLIAATTDAAAIAAHRASLEASEKAFSDEAQVIGLGPAFAKFGSADAMNMGGPAAAEFVRGAEAISKAVTGGDMSPTSPVTWSADKSIVASSGDLGVTIGIIKPKVAPPAGQPAGFPFFTVWRRDSVNQPWRYVAE